MIRVAKDAKCIYNNIQNHFTKATKFQLNLISKIISKNFTSFKGNAQFGFLSNPQKSLVNVHENIYKSYPQKT